MAKFISVALKNNEEINDGVRRLGGLISHFNREVKEGEIFTTEKPSLIVDVSNNHFELKSIEESNG